MIFAVVDGVPVFLVEKEAYLYGVSDFGDRNENGLPDFILYQWNGGNCCPGYIKLYEITQGGDIVDITPKDDNVYLIDMKDINQDGLEDIEGQGDFLPPGLEFNRLNYVYYYRWFAWNGTQYADMSGQLAPYYLREIKRLEQQLGSVCYLDTIASKYLAQIFVDYYAIGQLQQGYSEFVQPYLLSLIKMCSPLSQSNYGFILQRVLEEYQAIVVSKQVLW